MSCFDVDPFHDRNLEELQRAAEQLAVEELHGTELVLPAEDGLGVVAAHVTGNKPHSDWEPETVVAINSVLGSMVKKLHEGAQPQSA